MANARTDLNSLTRRVSRSFYLTLRMLPRAVRPQISLAYLAARATDTIADTRLLPVGSRRDALAEIRTALAAACEGRSAKVPVFREPAFDSGASPAEGELLRSMPAVLDELRGLSPEDRRLVGAVLDTIISGQEMDLELFGSASPPRIHALETDAQLDDYTFRVAGCVGKFWTLMCRAHLFPGGAGDDEELLRNGIRFGKGLQMTNILRDLPRDLRRGRCYLPRTRLVEHGLTPESLCDPAVMPRFRSLYASYLERAEQHLAAGWAYTNALPRTGMRLRLACAWPILIGLKTLARLRAANVLDDRHRVKVSRSQVRRLILRSLVSYPSPAAWERLYCRCRIGRGV